MAVIRIFANGIELDYDKDTLTIKKENNAFITDFKLSRASFPFKIIENARTKQALGTRDITSVLKKKVVPVTVLEMGTTYYGELEILGYMNGFRKCDLKYGSKILDILSLKLQDLLPVVSVIPGETEPVPFTEEALELVDGYEHWEDFPLGFRGKYFPEANYSFPMMRWKNKFGEDPDPGDEWYSYAQYYNKYYLKGPTVDDNVLKFMHNFCSVDGDTITVINTNVPSPQLFLLGILFYAFNSIGYKIEGEFVNDEFIKRLVVLSTKGNLCTVNILGTPIDFPFNEFDYEVFAPPYIYNVFKSTLEAEAEGEYTFKYKVREPLRPGGRAARYATELHYFVNQTSTLIYTNVNDPSKLDFEGEFTIPISADQIGQDFGLIYYRHYQYNTGVPTIFDVHGAINSKSFQMMHPTVPLGRYAPELSLSNFINEVKNLFCLKVTPDDVRKTVSFDYTGNVLKEPAKHIANKSLAIKDYEPPQKTAFILSYGNDQDTSLYISREGVELNRQGTNDYEATLKNGFKLVPVVDGTADLQETEDKDGIGLMIYDPRESVAIEDEEWENIWATVPLIASAYAGQALTMDGSYGIYETYWKTTIRFRLNASAVEMEGPFTESEIAKINALQKIYIDHQAYVILSLEYKKTTQDNYFVKLKMESINF